MSLPAASRLRIIVTGLIGQHPTLAGVAWDYAQYVVGLARLGHDVYYFEDSGQWPYSTDGGPGGSDWIVRDCRSNVDHLNNVMRRWGLEERWAYFCPVEKRWYGLPAPTRKQVVASADLLINVSGSLSRPARYRRVPRLVYIDSDPVFTQVKLNLGRGQERFKRRAALHDVFFSFGERLGPSIPDTPYRWLPTRQPVVLSEWRARKVTRQVFSTVMSWASYPPLRFHGRVYGQKDMEFRRFLDLPARVAPALLEVAIGDTRHVNWEARASGGSDEVRRVLAAHPSWTPADALRAFGWRVVSASSVGATLDAYRDYIESSLAEWSVAKSGYVLGESGWFSCRSACYLAAGKPVVVQDTGFSTSFPVGVGILPFRSAIEAIEAIRQVRGDYARHSRVARELAEEYFDAARVLPQLLERALDRAPKS